MRGPEKVEERLGKCPVKTEKDRSRQLETDGAPEVDMVTLEKASLGTCRAAGVDGGVESGRGWAEVQSPRSLRSCLKPGRHAPSWRDPDPQHREGRARAPEMEEGPRTVRDTGRRLTVPSESATL